MPTDQSNTGVTVLILRRAEDLAQSGQHLVPEAELLAAMAEGTIPFDLDDEEMLRRCIESLGSDAVIDAFVYANHYPEIDEQTIFAKESVQGPSRAKLIWRLTSGWLEKLADIGAWRSYGLSCTAAAIAILIVCALVYWESRPRERTAAESYLAVRRPDTPSPDKGRSGEKNTPPTPKTTFSSPTTLRPHPAGQASETGHAASRALARPEPAADGHEIENRQIATAASTHSTSASAVANEQSENESTATDQETAGQASRDPAAQIVEKIDSQIKLTKITADRSGIVTAGTILVLHKDGLVMFSSSTYSPPMNIYKDGRIQHNEAKNRLSLFGGRFKTGNRDTADLSSVPHRTFVADEKFWVTNVEAQQDGLVLTVYSDPYNDVRYYGQIKFPYPKNAPPPADDLVRTVEEVITVAPSDEKNDKADSDRVANKDSGKRQNALAPAAAIAPIAPPPPAADTAAATPKTISVGQTKEAVVAMWGQPSKIVKLSTKEIYYYPDMKITFVAGKVFTVN
jgi:hypothetical protein